MQVLRRPDSPYKSARLKLRAVERDARYAIVNLDEPDARREFTGRELVASGLPGAISEQPGAAVITYENLGGKPYASNL